MKKITAFISSRNPNSNTLKFTNIIKSYINSKDPEIFFDIITSENMVIYDIYNHKHLTDDLSKLKQTLLDSDLIILASPIMMQNISADMKSFLEHCSSWPHTLALNGKKSFVITTNYSNGHDTGINYLTKILTHSGSRVIGAINASSNYPNQLNNDKWINNTAEQLSDLLIESIYTPNTSSNTMEICFSKVKDIMKQYLYEYQNHYDNNLNNQQLQELKYWINNNMLNKESFQEVINSKNK